jgi:hypothetical protein
MRKDTPSVEMSAVDAARFLGTDLNYLYGQLRSGRLEGHKVDGRWVVYSTAVEERAQKRKRRLLGEDSQQQPQHTSNGDAIAV